MLATPTAMRLPSSLLRARTPAAMLLCRRTMQPLQPLQPLLHRRAMSAAPPLTTSVTIVCVLLTLTLKPSVIFVGSRTTCCS